MATRKNTRRGNNEGTIFQRKDGKWMGQITVGYSENGKIKRKSYFGHTRAEVALKMTTDLSAVMKNGYQTVSNEKFETLFMEWLLIFKRNTVLPRTLERILNNAKCHIVPEIGQYTLLEISPQVVQKLINKMYLQEMALDTIKKTKQIINQFFEYAIDNEMVQKNPTTKLRIQRNEKHIKDAQKYKAIPVDVRERFMQELEKNIFLKTLCTTMLFCGLRIGEALALTWRDIDIENKIIKINRATTVDVKIDKMGKSISRKTVIGTTKTACSVRIVPMPEKLLPILENWKEERWVMGKKTGCDLISLDSLVFGDKEGNVRTYYGTSTIFQKFIKSHGLSGYGLHLHGLRQTFSNILFENNVNPKVIQMLLGHKDVKTTIMNYNSVDQTYFAKTSNIINNSL
jgi:integrase